MARIHPIFATQLVFLSLVSSFALILVQAEYDHEFVKVMDLGLKKDRSSVSVVKSPGNSSTSFGAVAMIDDPLTEKPELSSKLLGRAQGFYALASQEELAILMSMNFHFTQGKYNGSTIIVMGRNQVFNKVREMPVIGGSGLFRFARGYVEARTHTFTPSTGDAIVEYNCYVLHY